LIGYLVVEDAMSLGQGQTVEHVIKDFRGDTPGKLLQRCGMDSPEATLPRRGPFWRAIAGRRKRRQK
jgi:hypothetical protein